MSYGGVVLGGHVSRPGEETAEPHSEILVFLATVPAQAESMLKSCKSHAKVMQNIEWSVTKKFKSATQQFFSQKPSSMYLIDSRSPGPRANSILAYTRIPQG